MDIGARQVVLVLGGGGALGAFGAGVYEALHAAGIGVPWLAGSSIGGINAALIVGNPPERRVAQLRTFWERIGEGAGRGGDSAGEARRVHNMMAATWARLFGRPGLYTPTLPRLFFGTPGRGWGQPALYDYAPAFATLRELIDFDRLNAGELRLTLNATDLRSGEPVRLDNRERWLGPEHVLASAALIPDFPPFEIDGRTLCDGGFSENVPVHAVLGEPPPADTLCIAVDLFARAAEPVWSLDGMAERRSDLTFANQTHLAVAGLRAAYAARSAEDGASVVLAMITYDGRSERIAQKIFDYSQRSIETRWAAGREQATQLLTRLKELPEPHAGRLLYVPHTGQPPTTGSVEQAGSNRRRGLAAAPIA